MSEAARRPSRESWSADQTQLVPRRGDRRKLENAPMRGKDAIVRKKEQQELLA